MIVAVHLGNVDPKVPDSPNLCIDVFASLSFLFDITAKRSRFGFESLRTDREEFYRRDDYDSLQDALTTTKKSLRLVHGKIKTSRGRNPQSWSAAQKEMHAVTMLINGEWVKTAAPEPSSLNVYRDAHGSRVEVDDFDEEEWDGTFEGLKGAHSGAWADSEVRYRDYENESLGGVAIELKSAPTPSADSKESAATISHFERGVPAASARTTSPLSITRSETNCTTTPSQASVSEKPEPSTSQESSDKADTTESPPLSAKTIPESPPKSMASSGQAHSAPTRTSKLSRKRAPKPQGTPSTSSTTTKTSTQASPSEPTVPASQEPDVTTLTLSELKALAIKTLKREQKRKRYVQAKANKKLAERTNASAPASTNGDTAETSQIPPSAI
jgi:hypothetical protein